MANLLFKCDTAEIWHGDSLDHADVAEIMGERVADALIVDAPYSPKTHEGHKSGKLTADRAAGFAAAKPGTKEGRYSARKSAAGESGRRDLDYAAWTPEIVDSFVSLWMKRCSGWHVSITDDALAPAWQSSFGSAGLYSFAPLPLVETGSRVRMTGDGPSNWTCWVVVARPKSRKFASWGTLPGAYIQPAERKINSTQGTDRIVGGKPLQSMIDIVSDYSRPGDLVVDQCVGAATTGLAALRTGRRFIGIDSSEERARLSAEIIAAEVALSNRRAVSDGQLGLFERVA